MPEVGHEFLRWDGCTREQRSQYNANLAELLPKLIYSPNIVNWTILEDIGCKEMVKQMLQIRLKEIVSDEEIFNSVAWLRAFNTKEAIYSELCYEFYSTYEFDEVCGDDELLTKKIIKFRLGGRNHSLSLLEFARRLGLYQADGLSEEGFEFYFQNGLRSSGNFNAQEYWLTIANEGSLILSRSSAAKI